MNTNTTTKTFNREDLRGPDFTPATLRGKTGKANFLGKTITGRFWAKASEARLYPDNPAELPEGESHIKIFSTTFNNLLPHILAEVTVTN